MFAFGTPPSLALPSASASLGLTLGSAELGGLNAACTSYRQHLCQHQNRRDTTQPTTISFVNTIPRWASMAPLWCLILDQREWPDDATGDVLSDRAVPEQHAHPARRAAGLNMLRVREYSRQEQIPLIQSAQLLSRDWAPHPCLVLTCSSHHAPSCTFLCYTLPPLS